MTRQISEIAKKESDIQYHITSLKPIRPENKADDWEKKALLEIKLNWEQRMIHKCESITYEFAFPDYRVRDLTNSVEGVNDTLVSAGVLKDDNWKVTGTITLMGHKAGNEDDIGVLITFNGVEYE